MRGSMSRVMDSSVRRGRLLWVGVLLLLSVVILSVGYSRPDGLRLEMSLRRHQCANELVMTLTNAGGDLIRFVPLFSLPWIRSGLSITIKAVALGQSCPSSPLRQSYPLVDVDPSAFVVVMRGRAVQGTLDLNAVLPDIRSTLESCDVRFEWKYKPAQWIGVVSIKDLNALTGSLIIPRYSAKDDCGGS